MDRRDFYFKQPVSEAELNGAFDAVEIALWRLITDWGLYGIASGMVGAQMTPTPAMAVSVSGPGYAYDQQGERIFIPAPWAPQPNGLDLSVDSNSIPTAVTVPGNERWLSVFVKFTRALSDPRVDGNSNSIFFQSNESFEFVVVQAGELAIGTAPRPDHDPTMLLLFDVHLVNGQTSVLNSDIDTTRRQDTFSIVQSPVSLHAGNVQSSIAAMLQALNNHILGLIGPHPDTGITSVARSGTHFSLAAGSVGSQLLAIQGELDSIAPSVAGSAIVKTNFTISAEAVNAQVADLATQVDTTESNVAHKLTKDGSDSITGTVTVASGGAVHVQSGGTLTVDAGAVVNLDGNPRPAVATPTIPTSGTYTLSAAEYECPVIDLGVVTTTGHLAIVFPNVPGVWQVICWHGGTGTGVVLGAGFHLTFAVSGGPSTLVATGGGTAVEGVGSIDPVVTFINTGSICIASQGG